MYSKKGVTKLLDSCDGKPLIITSYTTHFSINFKKGMLNYNFISSKFSLEISFSPNNNLRSILGYPKDQVNNLGKSGIYKHCDQVCMGQTKRTIKTRYKEYLTHLKFRSFDRFSVALYCLKKIIK